MSKFTETVLVLNLLLLALFGTLLGLRMLFETRSSVYWEREAAMANAERERLDHILRTRKCR